MNNKKFLPIIKSLILKQSSQNFKTQQLCYIEGLFKKKEFKLLNNIKKFYNLKTI